jgi:protein O-GlcNAc transferase
VGDVGRLCQSADMAIARGDWATAEHAYSRVVALGAADANIYNNLATLYDKQGVKEDEGFALIAKAHELAPQDANIRKNFANVLTRRAGALMEARRFREALPILQRKVEVEPESAFNQRNLGYCYAQTGDLETAIKYYSRAINLSPDEATYYNDLGLACFELRLLAEAQGAFQQVLKLKPESIVAYVHLGLLANLTGLTGIAVNMLQRAIDIDPTCGEAHNNMALFLRDRGELEACRRHYQQATELKPNHGGIFSGYLLSLNDDPNADPEWVAAEHRRYQSIVGGTLRSLPPGNRDPERKLRIGYMSPDFRTHSVAFFIAPVLEAHDREKVETILYGTGHVEDAVTKRIRGFADGWRKVFRMSDDDLARMIHDDGIDVLVEMSGHTCDNRLAMLARRVAPVQMTYLGYPNTTGLAEMDYRVTDAIADPPGQSEQWHTERLIRVEGGFLAFSPPEWSRTIAVASLPARDPGHVTFGSFNNLAKINDVVLDTWAAILERVPESTMLLKARGLRDERVQERILRAFVARGVDGRNRVRMMGHERSAAEHLRLYGQVDLALDTFPYNGTTTTCEALWMGTPVLTLEGASHAGLVGTSLLIRTGLAGLVAKSQSDYIEKAVALATDLAGLAAMRSGLRERFAASPVMDANRLARGLETAYRDAWRGFCAGSR